MQKAIRTIIQKLKTWNPFEKRPDEREKKKPIIFNSNASKRKLILFFFTVDGSLSQKASRQMLQASSQASCMPPSTKAAAEVRWVSIFFVSSIPTKPNTNITKSRHHCRNSNKLHHSNKGNPQEYREIEGMKENSHRCSDSQSSYPRKFNPKHSKGRTFQNTLQATTPKLQIPTLSQKFNQPHHSKQINRSPNPK